MWLRLDAPGLERFEADATSFRGRALALLGGGAWSIDYVVDFDPSWLTRSAQVTIEGSPPARSIDIRRERSGRWLLDGRELEACRDSLDLDLGMTPSTNTSAIRRLALEVGQSAELTATWVRFPGLEVQPLRQRYTRLEANAYRYESLRDGTPVFQARLDVDSTGLVDRYEGLFARIAGRD